MEVCQPEDLKGGDVIKNAAIIEAVLSGESGPATDVVLLNAAFVAVLADLAPDVSAGVELARAKIADGSALRILDALKAAQT
ncbi:MAG: anthranilate phosphoribosyltransferase [Candidatus Krumholzibacteriia bacterium]|jgi:anthranilate phosphoribosyltransferase